MSIPRTKTAVPYQNLEALDETRPRWRNMTSCSTSTLPAPSAILTANLKPQQIPCSEYSPVVNFRIPIASYLCRSVMAVQAANYAKQVYNQEFLLLNQQERSYVHENLCRYYCARFSTIRQDRPILSWHTCTCPIDVLPYELMSSVQYRTDSDGIQQCTILDYETSKALGGWVKVEHGDGSVEQLTKEDMLYKQGFLYEYDKVHPCRVRFSTLNC